MLFSLLLACGSSPQPLPSESPALKPDIVLVIVDTLRADHLGVYGHRRSTSITMDALADQGMWFQESIEFW